MPEIQAFRGLRYDLGHVGSLSDVIAPPYDVIGPELQESLYRKHPCNVVRLILNRIEPTDDEANNRYTRAGRFFKNWKDEGVLFQEADPALYVYHQEFEALGQTFLRRGFMARIRLQRFGEGMIFPHEQTMSKPKVDRLMLTAVCKANLSQVFGLYPDESCQVQGLLDQAIADKTPLVATDHLGVRNLMWPVTDVSIIAKVTAMMGPKPIFIADGHHRYETACDYRDQVYDSGFLSPEHPANYVLMQCVAMDDPGLVVLPTHRLLPDVPEMTAEELAASLGDLFHTRPAGEGSAAAGEVWEDVETTGRQDAIGVYTRKDRRWTILHLTDAGRQKMDEVAADRDTTWRQLGVSILHRLVIETLLAPDRDVHPKYVHLVEEVADGLESGEYPLAALVMPATVDHIRQVSMARERMPAKSTYFYPKLLSGLVLNPLEP
ncbi:MAG: DUF1015 domain-containing protein [Thermoguttaceae bacterium]